VGGMTSGTTADFADSPRSRRHDPTMSAKNRPQSEEHRGNCFCPNHWADQESKRAKTDIAGSDALVVFEDDPCQESGVCHAGSLPCDHSPCQSYIHDRDEAVRQDAPIAAPRVRSSSRPRCSRFLEADGYGCIYYTGAMPSAQPVTTPGWIPNACRPGAREVRIRDSSLLPFSNGRLAVGPSE